MLFPARSNEAQQDFRLVDRILSRRVSRYLWNKYRNTHNRSKCKCKDLVKPNDAIKIGDLGWFACGLLES